MNFPKEATVTDQRIDISFFSDTQKNFVRNITESIISNYTQSKAVRQIVGIAGPSGAGKSLLSVLVQTLAKDHYPNIPIYAVSIDAFHFHNNRLRAHHADGKTLMELKGRYDTYDIQALEDKLNRFAALEALSFPTYSRKLHEPVDDAIIIEEGPGILIIEGLWLLYDDHGWENIRQYLSHTYFLSSGKNSLREHTIKRHIAGGRSEREAAEQYEQNDLKNAELVLKTISIADESLLWPN